LLALADDCSAKDDCFSHDAASRDLAAAKVKIVPDKLIDKTHSNNCVVPSSHSAQFVSASIFNAASASVSAIISWWWFALFSSYLSRHMTACCDRAIFYLSSLGFASITAAR
jgi:hypothetical protein